MNKELIADVLEDAADYIDKHGWCQNTLLSDDGKVCALGAMGMVTQTLFVEWTGYGADDPMISWTVGTFSPRSESTVVSAAKALDDYLAHHFVESHQGGRTAPFNVTAWNDSRFRTKEQVVDALRGAAKHALTEAE